MYAHWLWCCVTHNGLIYKHASKLLLTSHFTRRDVMCSYAKNMFSSSRFCCCVWHKLLFFNRPMHAREIDYNTRTQFICSLVHPDGLIFRIHHSLIHRHLCRCCGCLMRTFLLIGMKSKLKWKYQKYKARTHTNCVVCGTHACVFVASQRGSCQIIWIRCVCNVYTVPTHAACLCAQFRVIHLHLARHIQFWSFIYVYIALRTAFFELHTILLD